MCLGPEIVLAVQAIAAVAAVGGTAYSVVKGEEASAASKKAEALRKQQMQLEEMQKRRKTIRDFQLKRATSLSNISGQTGTLDNSATGGSLSALSSGVGSALGELSQAGAIGEGMFDANAAYSEATASAQTGAAIGSFGKDLFQSAPAIGRIGSTLFNSPNPWTTSYEKA